MDQDASSNSRSHPEGLSAAEASTSASNDETNGSDDVTTSKVSNDVTVLKGFDDDETKSNVVVDVSSLRGFENDTAVKVSPDAMVQTVADDITNPNTVDDVTVSTVGSDDRFVVTRTSSSGEMDIARGDTHSLTPADHLGSIVEGARNMCVQGDMHGDMNIAGAINNHITMEKPRFSNTVNTVINKNITVEGPHIFTGPVHCPHDVSGYNNLKEHSEAEIRLGAAVFTPTAAFRRALNELLDHKMLILTGPRASGKTSLATALLRHQQGDRTPLVPGRFAEFRNHIRADWRQVVLLEDVFGRTEFSYTKFQKWYRGLEVLVDFCKRGDCLAVITISDGVMSELKARCNFDTVLNNCSLMQMQSAEPFTQDEKAELIKKHLHEAGKSHSQSIVEDVLVFDTSRYMFPHCCQLFAGTALSSDDVKQTFVDEAASLTSQSYRPGG